MDSHRCEIHGLQAFLKNYAKRGDRLPQACTWPLKSFSAIKRATMPSLNSSRLKPNGKSRHMARVKSLDRVRNTASGTLAVLLGEPGRGVTKSLSADYHDRHDPSALNFDKILFLNSIYMI